MTMITMVIFTFGVLTFNPCLPSEIQMSEGLEENNPLNECLPAFHPSVCVLTLLSYLPPSLSGFISPQASFLSTRCQPEK